MGAVRLGPGSRGGRVLVALALARDYLGVDSNQTSSSRTRKINRAEVGGANTRLGVRQLAARPRVDPVSRHVLGPVCETYAMGDLLYHAMDQGPDDHESRLLYAYTSVLASVCGAIEKRFGARVGRADSLKL